MRQFTAGRFFEQHETLESLWRETRTPVRELYHGIIQVGVGFHHWGRGNFHGAAVLLEEGIRRLEPFAPACQGVDVAALVAAVRACHERLIELGEDRMREYDMGAAPRIHLEED